MLFVTQEFLVFFVVVLAGYWLIPAKYRIVYLIGASLFFYATWSARFTVHLLIVVSTNYVVMELWKIYRRNWMFYLLQAANVLNIAVFKYYYFFADVIGSIFGIDSLLEQNLRAEDALEGGQIFLPLAISFYTFQIMSYGIDIYRGQYTLDHTFREVLLFKSFFPQLIAGPIMRSSELLPQIQNARDFKIPDTATVQKAVWLILAGVVKKLLIADQISAAIAPSFYSGPASLGSVEAWLVVIGAIGMLYADFSAYTDLARGCGLLLGFDIPINFKAPLFMVSMSDFWRRWHLTFSRWIRDYIYIPLGGSRVPEWRNYINLGITFFLGGLWHGASYTFVLWGTLIGLLLSVESFMFKRGLPEWPQSLLGRAARIVFSWFILVTSSAFFFGTDLSWSLGILGRMFDFTQGSSSVDTAVILGGLAGVLFFHLIEEFPQRFEKFRKHDGWLLPVVVLIVIVSLTQFAGPGKDFFYFQF